MKTINNVNIEIRVKGGKTHRSIVPVTDYYKEHGYPNYESSDPEERKEDYRILDIIKKRFPEVTSWKLI